MRVIYDSVSADYVYLLSKADVVKVGKHVASSTWDRIEHIRFGCCGTSAHTGRMARRGRSYRIRVNFCPKRVEGRLESPLACRQEHYVKGVKRCGGKIDLTARTITWDLESARRYAFYVLLHEIGHVAYAEKGLPGSEVARPISKEEDWCDTYSAGLMQKIDTSE